MMIFLALMLLLGLAIVQLTTTEVSVGRNVNLAAEAFSVADAGAAHAYELVRYMNGDFTALLRGSDEDLKDGNEFSDHPYKIYSSAGAIVATSPAIRMFDLSKVRPIPETNGRALVPVDAHHFYELIVYDNAGDPKAYLGNARFEHDLDPADRPDVDGDQRVLIRSIGYVTARETTLDAFDPNDQSNVLSSAVVDVVIGLTPFPAVVSNGDLEITNAVSISGGLGGVHANDDLLLDAGTFAIQQSATFSDDDTNAAAPSGANQTAHNPQVQGFNGTADPLTVPRLNPFRPEIARQADLIYLTPLSGSGNGASPFLRASMLTALGGNAAALVAAADPTDTQTVVLKSDHAANPTYTVEEVAAAPTMAHDGVTLTIDPFGSVALPGLPGGSGKTVLVLMPQGSDRHVTLGASGNVTLVTNGSVEVHTNTILTSALKLSLPEYPPWYQMDVLVIAGEDLLVSGTAGAGDKLTGVLYAYEQFDVDGSGTISGQVVGYEHALVYSVAEGTYASSPTLFTTAGSPLLAGGSILRGNLNVSHDPGGRYVGSFAIASWRQLRDFDQLTAAR